MCQKDQSYFKNVPCDADDATATRIRAEAAKAAAGIEFEWKVNWSKTWVNLHVSIWYATTLIGVSIIRLRTDSLIAFLTKRLLRVHYLLGRAGEGLENICNPRFGSDREQLFPTM